MGDRELWFWFWAFLFGAITLTSIFKSIFYYKWEAKRQMKLAECGFDPREE